MFTIVGLAWHKATKIRVFSEDPIHFNSYNQSEKFDKHNSSAIY